MTLSRFENPSSLTLIGSFGAFFVFSNLRLSRNPFQTSRQKPGKRDSQLHSQFLRKKISKVHETLCSKLPKA